MDILKDFESVKEFVHELKFTTPAQWIMYWSENQEELEKKGIPRNVNIEYQENGWNGWDDFLGSFKLYYKFSECQELVSKMNFKSIEDWKKYCKSGAKPESIPDNPHIIYNDFWEGWDQFLGIKKDSLMSKMIDNKVKNTQENDSEKKEQNTPSFDVVRDFIRISKIKSEEDWGKFCKSNKMPKNFPNNPNIFYADKGWVSWDNFLGITKSVLSFIECRMLLRKSGFKSISDWEDYKNSKNRAVGIPDFPDIFYKDEWIGWEDFLGIEDEKMLDIKFPKIKKIKALELEDGTKFVKYNIAIDLISGLNLKTKECWFEYCESGRKPEYIPDKPYDVYKFSGWISWGEWLNCSENFKIFKEFLPHFEALNFIETLKLNTIDDWFEYIKSGEKPSNIPFNPNVVYENNGWKGWRTWFGSRNCNLQKKYGLAPWSEVKSLIIENNIKKTDEWLKLSKNGKIPLNIPLSLKIYKEWTSFYDIIGIEKDSPYLSMEEAIEFIKPFNFKTATDWKNFCKEGNRPENIPREPHAFYRKNWKGWGYFLNSHEAGKSKQEICYLLNIIKEKIENLDVVEILIILEKFGVTNKFKNNDNFLNIIKSNPTSLKRNLNTKLLIKDFSSGLDKEKINNEILEIINKDESIGDDINEIKNLDKKIKKYTEIVNKSLLYNNDIISNKKYFKTIKTFDYNSVVSYLDDENIKFLIDYRIQKLWNDIINKKFTIEEFEDEEGDEYFSHIKKLFINEYYDVLELHVPDEYCFQDENGKVLELNLMQKLTAYKLKTKKKFGNWSEAGAGKTLAAVFSSRYINAKSNLIIAFNSTVDYWKKTILNAFPDSVVNAKNKDEIVWIEGSHNYLILNYETFQQKNSENFVNHILREINFDFIVVDEIQNSKQRNEFISSKRKALIHNLLINAEKNNPDISFLFMSCTPVINNLIEPIKMLEMLNGISYSELDSKLTVNNAIEVYKHFVINGIRVTSTYNDINLKEKIIKTNGNHLIDKLKFLPGNAILSIEKILIKDKLLSVENKIKPGTLIYTFYVSDIVDEIKDFIEKRGFSVGLYTGIEKEGLVKFVNGDVDVLIGSYPISIGVDGIQKVCNRLIALTLPWTSSEYQNLIGRIKRQGSNFKDVDVIIPQIEINLEKNIWSWDSDRLERIRFKRTLADTALDGIVSDDDLPSKSEMFKNSIKSINEWIWRVENNEERKIDRRKLVIQ